MIKYFSFLTIASCLLAGCISQKKKEDQAFRFFRENPDKGAAFCADKFHRTDSIGEPVVKYIPADNKSYAKQLDSLQALSEHLLDEAKKDSTINSVLKESLVFLDSEIKKLKGQYKPCVPDTVKKTIPHFIDNPEGIAKLNTEHNQRIKAETENNQHKKSANTWMWIAIAEGILLLLFIWLLVRR